MRLGLVQRFDTVPTLLSQVISNIYCVGIQGSHNNDLI